MKWIAKYQIRPHSALAFMGREGTRYFKGPQVLVLRADMRRLTRVATVEKQPAQGQGPHCSTAITARPWWSSAQAVTEAYAPDTLSVPGAYVLEQAKN
jgi:hypothetical protein